MDCETFWETKRSFADKYGVHFVNEGNCAPSSSAEVDAEFRANLDVVISVLRRDQALVDYLADRLVAIGDSVPRSLPTFRLGARGNPFEDPRLADYRSYPADLYAAPGNRKTQVYAATPGTGGALGDWSAPFELKRDWWYDTPGSTNNTGGNKFGKQTLTSSGSAFYEIATANNLPMLGGQIMALAQIGGEVEQLPGLRGLRGGRAAPAGAG